MPRNRFTLAITSIALRPVALGQANSARAVSRRSGGPRRHERDQAHPAFRLPSPRHPGGPRGFGARGSGNRLPPRPPRPARADRHFSRATLPALTRTGDRGSPPLPLRRTIGTAGTVCVGHPVVFPLSGEPTHVRGGDPTLRSGTPLVTVRKPPTGGTAAASGDGERGGARGRGRQHQLARERRATRGRSPCSCLAVAAAGMLLRRVGRGLVRRPHPLTRRGRRRI